MQAAPSKNAPCPCGSGKKYKRCCGMGGTNQVTSANQATNNIQQIIGLRYETTFEQLRYVLAKVREMFVAHPSIDSETVRIRFVGYGSSSLDIEIRVYALTNNWNEFFAIQEDGLLY